MSELKDLTRKWFADLWNAGRLDTIDELTTPQTVFPEAAGDETRTMSRDDYREFVRAMRAAVSEFHIEVVGLFEDGQTTIARCIVTGRHTGEGLGIPPTGNPIRISGVTTMEWEGGRAVRGSNNFDLLGLYEQIGALKRPDGA